VCPRCGSTAEVRTVQELFDMLNSMQNDAMQQAGQLRSVGRSPARPGRTG
jgi:hypothetical protein